jgi:hypothetical protein
MSLCIDMRWVGGENFDVGRILKRLLRRRSFSLVVVLVPFTGFFLAAGDAVNWTQHQSMITSTWVGLAIVAVIDVGAAWRVYHPKRPPEVRAPEWLFDIEPTDNKRRR